MLILDDGDLFYIEGEAKRMEVERADTERVAFDATIQFAFCIGTQGLMPSNRSTTRVAAASHCHTDEMIVNVVVLAKTRVTSTINRVWCLQCAS